MTVAAPKQRRRPASAKPDTTEQPQAEATSTEEAAVTAPATEEATPGPDTPAIDGVQLELVRGRGDEKPKESPEERDARLLNALVNKTQQRELGDELKAAYSQAEDLGLNRKALKEVVRLLGMDTLDRDDLYDTVNLYLRRLGHQQLRLPFTPEAA